MEKSRKRFRTIWVILSWLIILLIMSVNPCIGAEDPAKFPSKPITMIIPWPPGGTTDMAIRKLSDLASKTLGQPILIENKGGGSGVIGINAISKAANDGYTIGNMTHSPIVVVPHMRSVPYNPIEDFTFIMQYGEFMHAFCVLSTSPWKTLKEYIEDARKNPGKLTYSTPGPLSVPHIFMQQLAIEENVKVNHVPVQGDAEMATVHLGGHVDASLGSTLIPYIPTGRVRGLAVASEARFNNLPDVATFPELGYKMDYPNFTGFIAPKGVDPRIVKKIQDALKKAWDDPSFKEFCFKIASTAPLYRDSASFKAVVVRNYEQLGISLKKTGLAK